MNIGAMKFTLLFVLTLSFGQLYATGQGSEFIIYKGDTLQMMSEPLEPYLSANEPRGNFYLPLKDGCSTALWRGYVGLWEIRDDRLYLIDVYACGNKAKSIKNKIFKDNELDIVASWFTGKLFVEKGKVIKYHHSGYDRIYEQEIVIDIDGGDVKGMKTYENGVKPTDKGFSRNPEEILTQIYENIDWSGISKLSKEFKLFLTFQIGDNGESINTEIKGDLSGPYKTALQNALRSLPPIQVLYSRGQPSHEGWTMMIVFSGQSRRKYAR